MIFNEFEMSIEKIADHWLNRKSQTNHKIAFLLHFFPLSKNITSGKLTSRNWWPSSSLQKLYLISAVMKCWKNSIVDTVNKNTKNWFLNLKWNCLLNSLFLLDVYRFDDNWRMISKWPASNLHLLHFAGMHNCFSNGPNRKCRKELSVISVSESGRTMKRDRSTCIHICILSSTCNCIAVVGPLGRTKFFVLVMTFMRRKISPNDKGKTM